MGFDLNSLPRHDGRIAIVTGANTGLGFETTKAFARKGITTVVACRTEARALAAKGRIEAEVEDADLLFMPLDLSNLQSVRDFASAFRKQHTSLDILVLNAGIMTPPYAKTVDGFESQMGANFFGHFLLTSLLIDLMPDAPSSRVVALSSNAHKMGEKRIVFEDLNWERKYPPMGAYAQTKLACLMFMNALDRRLHAQGSSIVALSAHPGMSLTDLSSSGSAVTKAINGALKMTLGPFLAQPPKEGAQPQIRAALDESARGGEYYGPTGFQEFKGPPGKVEQLPYALDAAEQDRLWVAAEEATGAVFSWSAQSS
jgi:NAD(P)-dependent dehydrogenase (short-subunit alcohol dehydrogenase family)